MIKSMTGFGVSNYEDENITISVEVKTLNSRTADINLRLPKLFQEKEMELRSLIIEQLRRGKLIVAVDVLVKDSTLLGVSANKELFRQYYKEFKKLADDVGASHELIFKLAAQSPDIFTAPVIDVEVVNEQWEKLRTAVTEACRICDQFRTSEGEFIEGKLAGYIEEIQVHLDRIAKLDEQRIKKIRKRIQDNFQQFLSDQEIDQNRFEQELIYYLEKLDISEEKVRLKSHLDYFSKELRSEISKGKTLGFISQEMGREINTIGSKANDAKIQQEVIRMKEELEKIKEQVQNVL